MTATSNEVLRFNRSTVAELNAFLKDRAIDEYVPRRIVKRGAAPLPLVEAFRSDKRLYLTGEPGEGKSTVIVYSAAELINEGENQKDTIFFLPLYRLSQVGFDSPEMIVNWLKTNSPAREFRPDFVADRLHSR